jgi:serine protease Do
MTFCRARCAVRIAPLGWTLLVLAIGLGRESRQFGSELRRDAVVLAIQRAQPSVVNIHGEKQLRPGETRFGPIEGGRRVNGMGTGVLIDERGYILTNFHVVDGVEEINVTRSDGTAYIARLVASDAQTDLAVIRIEADEPLPVVPVGNSSDLLLGEPVIALGNAYGYENTVTRGIVSALHRSVQVTDTQSYDDLIQTDASINPGNSGGPLVNIDGEMIGINVAVRAGAAGIGFAIPVDRAMRVAAELLSTRVVDQTWHGLVLKPAGSAGTSGCLVVSVDQGSPAADSGIQAGDRIEAVSERSIDRPLDLERALLGLAAGESVEVTLQRDEEELRLPLVMGDLSDAAVEEGDDNWRLLGLRLEPIPPRQFEQLSSRYRGGLRVTEVRHEGPAARQGIRPDDVLVGMHLWETVSLENVEYILDRAQNDDLGPLKFYILRGKETLFGHVTVARLTRP